MAFSFVMAQAYPTPTPVGYEPILGAQMKTGKKNFIIRI
jgi:hypothetical protein